MLSSAKEQYLEGASKARDLNNNAFIKELKTFGGKDFSGIRYDSVLDFVLVLGKVSDSRHPFLPIGRGLLGGTTTIHYSLFVELMSCRSLNTVSPAPRCYKKSMLHTITLYAEAQELDDKKQDYLVLGRLVFDETPTYWIVMMDKDLELYAFRAEEIGEPDSFSCDRKTHHESVCHDRDAHMCILGEQPNREVFGKGSDWLAVKLGSLSILEDAINAVKSDPDLNHLPILYPQALDI